MPVEIKMIAGAFLTIGITGAVISLVDGTLLGVFTFLLVSIISICIIVKQ